MKCSVALNKIFSKKVRVAIIVVLIASTAPFAFYVYAGKFQGRIAPNTYIGSVPVGGMTQEDTLKKVQKRADELLNSGVVLSFEGANKTIPLTFSSAEDLDISFDYIDFNIEDAVLKAYSAKTRQNAITDAFYIFRSLIIRRVTPLDIEVNTQRLTADISALFPDAERPAVDAKFLIEQSGDEFKINIEPSASGTKFETEKIIQEMSIMLGDLTTMPIVLSLVNADPMVSEAAAESLVPIVQNILINAPYDFTFKKNNFETLSWNLTAEDLMKMLAPESIENNIEIGLTGDDALAFFGRIAETVNVAASNARVKIEGKKATVFSPSKEGVEFDKRATILKLVEEVNAGAKNSAIEIAVTKTKPDIATGDVNNLGIDEIIGVGFSNFAGSPNNRIKNIRNGANKLNGILIAPNEEFSLLNALKPFTSEGGYLPELVIKGDKIEPEIGGGLCQIGTTTFRATMNSGLPITKRQNHSLVVSYYNDPANKNPGTDATIYDPNPDFKFINDTGNYILFTTEMNEKIGELKFTFWGTSDGRRGYYDPPKVLNWIPAGEMKKIETTNLPVGVEKCQGAHNGANTEFTYYIERVGKEIEETLYASHYRPLPKICLVGVEKLSEPVVPAVPADGVLPSDGSSPNVPVPEGAETGASAFVPVSE